MKPYYEGWYLKQQQGDNVLAVIPGRSQNSAFIQVITPSESHFVEYPLASYSRRAAMRVGSSTFSPSGMDVDVQTDGLKLRGQVRYHATTPLRYDIMGPFSLLPMETKHAVFSMRHRVEGSVSINGRTMRFDDGLGYMEGDRGHSFPSSYVWVQSVDFPRGASVMAAVAGIPLAGLRFTGCIAVVLLDGKEYRFATYLGVRVVEASECSVHLRQRGMDLRIEFPDARGHRLQAPASGAMDRPIREIPDAPARFLFAKNGRTLLESACARTSFELVVPEERPSPSS